MELVVVDIGEMAAAADDIEEDRLRNSLAAFRNALWSLFL
jgi:hypothetical protein